MKDRFENRSCGPFESSKSQHLQHILEYEQISHYSESNNNEYLRNVIEQNYEEPPVPKKAYFEDSSTADSFDNFGQGLFKCINRFLWGSREIIFLFWNRDSAEN